MWLNKEKWFVLQDVLVVNSSAESMANNHVLATCRTALKKQGVVGLNMAPCMRAFLERLPIMLQEQYAYEKVHTTTNYDIILVNTVHVKMQKRDIEVMSFSLYLVCFSLMWCAESSSCTVLTCSVWRLWRWVCSWTLCCVTLLSHLTWPTAHPSLALPPPPHLGPGPTVSGRGFTASPPPSKRPKPSHGDTPSPNLSSSRTWSLWPKTNWHCLWWEKEHSNVLLIWWWKIVLFLIVMAFLKIAHRTTASGCLEWMNRSCHGPFPDQRWEQIQALENTQIYL